MIDHRAVQTPVRNQGDRPTCVGFAISGAHEWLAVDGEFRSVEHAIWAGHQVTSIPGREETSVAWSLTGLDRYRHASEIAWRYGAPEWSVGPPAAALDHANCRELPPWKHVPSPGLDAIRVTLAAGEPVILTLRVVRSAWQEPQGVIDAEPGRKTPGNHAVLAVGVTEPREYPEHLLIKNSWGKHWGDQGYGTVSRRYFEHYAVAVHTLRSA